MQAHDSAPSARLRDRAASSRTRVDGSLESELHDVLLPHEVAAVAAVGPTGAPSFVLQVRRARGTAAAHGRGLLHTTVRLQRV